MRLHMGLGLLGLGLACACSDPNPPASDGDGDEPTETAALATEDPTEAEPVQASFFVTSLGGGNGGDLGGLSGADARCSELAMTAGLAERQWRAFLSTAEPVVHARDRIGPGPWTNVAGAVVAADLASLEAGGIASADMLDEYGDPAGKTAPPGREHDILTGSDAEGRLDPSARTCADWTSNLASDRARVGHHDWSDLPSDAWAQHWSSVHNSRCDPPSMADQLGTARTYCFAIGGP